MGFLEQNPATSTNLDFPKSPPAHTEILDEKGVKHLLEYLEKEPLMWKVLIHLALCTNRYVHALLDADIVAADTLEQKLNFMEVGQKKDKKIKL